MNTKGRIYTTGKIFIFNKARWINSDGYSRYLTFFERVKVFITRKAPDGLNVRNKHKD